MVQRWNGSTQRNCSDPAPMMLGLPSLSMGDGARPRPAPLSTRPSANEKLACNRRSSQDCDSRSEEHTSELQSLMRISYAVFCLKKKRNTESSRTYNEQHAKSKQ